MPSTRDQRPNRLPMKRPVAPESGPVTKQRRTVSPPTMTHQEKSRDAADMEVLPDDPETRALYRQHWQSIRTEEATDNRVQDSYNFTLHEMTAFTFTEMIHRIFREQTQPSRLTCLLVFSYGTSRLVNYATTIPARKTPDFFMFHTSSEQKKTWRGFWRS